MSEGLRDEDVMPEGTACLFREIMKNPLLDHFILIGGTALSLHIRHRISEDLDFITLLPRLPRAALMELERQLLANGHKIEHLVNPGAYEDFQISGLELADQQQDWIVDGEVKLTFFAAEPQHLKLLGQTHERKESDGGFKIAMRDELCCLKATVTASRSKSRDWLDLFVLERDYGFGVACWKEAFDRAGLSPMQFEIALNRMCEGRLGAGDEGYSALLPDAPGVPEMQERFRKLREEYEQTMAQQRMRELLMNREKED